MHNKALNNLVRIVIWFSSKKDVHKLYFSTDITMSGKDIIEFYRSRFQIEFNFRDAKQHVGLCNSQSRNIDKMNFNASLTTINLTKAYAIRLNKPFSMASIKTMIMNRRSYWLNDKNRLKGNDELKKHLDDGGEVLVKFYLK